MLCWPLPNEKPVYNFDTDCYHFLDGTRVTKEAIEAMKKSAGIMIELDHPFELKLKAGEDMYPGQLINISSDGVGPDLARPYRVINTTLTYDNNNMSTIATQDKLVANYVDHTNEKVYLCLTQPTNFPEGSEIKWQATQFTLKFEEIEGLQKFLKEKKLAEKKRIAAAKKAQIADLKEHVVHAEKLIKRHKEAIKEVARSIQST